MSQVKTLDSKGQALWPGLLIFTAALLLAGVTFSNLWLYWGNQPASDGSLPDTLSSLTTTTGSPASSTALNKILGGTGAALLALLTFSVWRQSYTRQAKDALQRSLALKEELDGLRIRAQRYKSERTLLEAQVEKLQDEMENAILEKTGALERRCHTLENELNSRRQAEQALSFQAKELERSKDVLELHVQARTKELQELKSRYELILNSAGDGIYGLDANGRTTFVNPAAAKMTGWDVDEIVGKPEHEIFYGLEQDTAKEANTAIRDKDGRYLDEQEFVRRDGTRFVVEYVRTTITVNDRLFGSVVTFKDITERKRHDDALSHKAAELARSNAELEQFAYVASHDLQEPLRKIQAFGDRLRKKCEGTLKDDSADYLNRMLNAAARMQTLINDLLTFSRVISTNQPFRSVNLNKVVREVLSDLEVRIEQSKAQVEVEELPSLEADHTQMRQLIQNLVSNALKFHASDKPPVVRIYSEIEKVPYTGGDGQPEQQRCCLIVQDQGIGFEDCYLEKIFAVFQRLHGRSEYEGTGVGLAVCRRIVDRHGGTITAQGSPGKGATFRVTLPMQQPQSEDAS